VKPPQTPPPSPRGVRRNSLYVERIPRNWSHVDGTQAGDVRDERRRSCRLFSDTISERLSHGTRLKCEVKVRGYFASLRTVQLVAENSVGRGLAGPVDVIGGRGAFYSVEPWSPAIWGTAPRQPPTPPFLQLFGGQHHQPFSLPQHRGSQHMPQKANKHTPHLTSP
jgi:hypothetical protein